MLSLRRLPGLLWDAARWQTVGAVALSTALSLTEGLGLAALFPLIALLGDGAHAPAGGARTQVLFNSLARLGLPQQDWLPALLIALVLILGALAQLNGMLEALQLKILLLVEEKLAIRLFGAILHADWAFLTRKRQSDMAHLLNNEVVRVGQLAANVLALLSSSMVTLLVLAVALWLAPLLTLGVLVCFGVLIPLQRRSRQRIRAGGERLTTESRAVYDSSVERLGNLKLVKAYGAQRTEWTMFRTRYGAVSHALMRNLAERNAATRRFSSLGLALLCAILLVGLRALHLSSATMLVFLAAFVRVMPRLNQLQMSAGSITVDLPALRQIDSFLAECAQNSEAEGGDAPAPTLEHALHLRAVSFSYGDRPVLDGVDLTVETGKLTAIAGFSGAGKSTIADIVLGLIAPQAGKIECDNIEIDPRNANSWRRHIGYVSQDTHLFHDSVRANLLWATPSASDQDLQLSIAEARAEFVYTLAEGLETVVGDRGVRLSHGQRQRIALARAFLLRPRLLILDEATNSLDLENEEAILAAVRGRSVLLISHRPSALKTADQIYVLDRGKVKASGTWAEVRSLVEEGE